MKRKRCIVRSLAVWVWIWSLAACAGEEPVAGGVTAPATPQGRPVTALLSLAVEVSGAADAPRIRSTADGLTTPGTGAESAVRTLTVFLVGVDEAGHEESRAQYVTFPVVWDGTESLTRELRLETTTGRKHIYVGANMTQRQIAAFAGETGNGVNAAYTVSTGIDYIDYDEMMAEFVTEGGFTMTGRATMNGAERIEVPDRPDPRLDLEVSLTRVVAKVLVVAEADPERTEGGVEYAQVSSRDNGDGSEDGPDEKSWIRLSDMRFMLNVANRRSFLYPRRDEAGRTVDPNYEFESMIEYADDAFHFKSDYDSRQFVRWLPHIWNAENNDQWGMPVQKYVPERMPGAGTAADVYHEGLYCLENAVGAIPDEWKLLLDGNEEGVTFLATTYVLVAARMTPRRIVTAREVQEAIEMGDPAHPVPSWMESEAVAADTLAADPGNPEGHPDGTFYTPDRETFYSYSGMMARIAHDETLPEDDPDKLTRENFLVYPKGWGYYFTYVDGSPNEAYGGETLKFSDRSSVLRNCYYILRVKKLGAAPFPGEGRVNSMEVDVRRYGWTHAGTGDITLKP